MAEPPGPRLWAATTVPRQSFVLHVHDPARPTVLLNVRTGERASVTALNQIARQVSTWLAEAILDQEERTHDSPQD